MNLLINRLSKNQQEFLEKIKKQCDKHNVILHLENSQGIEFQNTGILCNGYFVDSPHPKLGVATKKDIKDWFLVLLHEYCHMEQWLEKSPYWTKNKMDKGDASDLIDSWMNNEIEIDSKKLEELFNIVILLESDCEVRAIQNISNFQLDISKEEYAQKANSYILFYHVVKKHRKWYNIGHEPYSIPSVWQKMPTHMNLDYTKIDHHLLEILGQCLKSI